MKVPSGPKGTRDFYPDEMAVREYLFSTWQRTCRRYGFKAYDGPMFEQLEVFTHKAGPEIEKQLYTFEDKGGRMMALRPEMTPSLARMVAAKGTSLKRPIRWYSIARLFRYEKMQRGRLREFFQLNMDILGSVEISADAELIAAVVDCMRDLGLTGKDFQVRISSRTLLEEIFNRIDLPSDRFPALYALLDRKNKIPEQQYLEDLSGIIPEKALRNRITALFSVRNLEDIPRLFGQVTAFDTLSELFLLLDTYGMKDFVRFDIGIVRGLAYYTGLVFEIFDIDKGMRSIAGGGRYDRLVELYGGPPTPAVGFAAGDVVLVDLLREKGLLPSPAPRSSVFLVAIDAKGYGDLVPVAQQLRSSGISCEFSLKKTGIVKQMKQAGASRAPVTVFLGGDEGRKGNCRVKLMSTGAEEEIPGNELVKKITTLLLR